MPRVETREGLYDLYGLLNREAVKGSWLAFDLETRSPKGYKFEDWHDESRIVSVSFSPSPGQAYVVPLSHPSSPWAGEWVKVSVMLFQVLRGAKLVGHNVKYDARWVLSRTGVDLSPSLAWDTQAGAFLMDENQALGLKTRAVQDLGVDPWDDVNLEDAEQVPWSDLARYNGLDTRHTYALHEWQRERLREQPELGKVMWHILMPAVRNLARIEHTGLLLDQDEVASRTLEATRERDELYRQFEAQVPGDLAVKFQERFGYGGQRLFEVEPVEKERLSLAPTSKFFKQYASEKWPVIETTNKGAPSWDASVLKRLAKQGYQDAEILVRYRKVDKQLSTYLHRWPHDVAADGRIRATYKPMRVVTGRMSCERPNLQQVDRKLKTVFIPEPGWSFVQADYSQVELRFAAWLSGDEGLLTEYLSEHPDVHRKTASAVTGKPEDEITDEERYKAKAVNFGFLYGQLPPGFQNYARDVYEVDVTLEEAEQARARYFGLYPGLLDYHERMRREVRRRGQVRSPFGRVRRLPEINSKDQQRRWSAERQAINFPIQSGASDLLMLALSAVTEWANRWEGGAECRVVGTVHDSILLEVRQDALDVLDTVGKLMTDPPGLEYFTNDIPVPIVVECEVGPRWGESEKVLEFSSDG